MQKPGLPKGTRDFGPEVSIKRKYIISTIERIFRLYGFHPLETPSMENLSVLTGKYGDEGDQLLFKVLNSGDFLKKADLDDFRKGSRALLPKIAEKGLRYDLTVQFARYVVMNQDKITFPFKRYQIQPVWRADRPQKGRYREFYQCDVDIIGNQSDFQLGWKEVELTLMVHEVMSQLGLQAYEIKVNHREVLFGIAAYVGMTDREIAFCVSLDKLDKIGREAVLDEIEAQGGDRQALESILQLIESEKKPVDMLDALRSRIGAGDKGFDELTMYFDSLPVEKQVSLDFSLARGLSYYTGMIFEVVPTAVRMGSICGGGRYDNLTGVFGLKGVSGIGISFGLDRLYDVLEESGLFPGTTHQGVRVLITHFEDNHMKHGFEVISQLRKRGIPSELYPERAKIKKQFHFADKNHIPWVITIGDEEMKSGMYAFKELSSGHQELLTLDQIISRLTSE